MREELPVLSAAVAISCDCSATAFGLIFAKAML
jgi:hypothetical protein